VSVFANNWGCRIYYSSLAPRPVPRPLVKGTEGVDVPRKSAVNGLKKVLAKKTIHLEPSPASNLRSSKVVRKSPRLQKP
jgi:hypothetical protein